MLKSEVGASFELDFMPFFMNSNQFKSCVGIVQTLSEKKSVGGGVHALDFCYGYASVQQSSCKLCQLAVTEGNTQKLLFLCSLSIVSR